MVKVSGITFMARNFVYSKHPCERFFSIPLGSCLSRGISVNGYISKILYRTVAWAIPWRIAPLFFAP